MSRRSCAVAVGVAASGAVLLSQDAFVAAPAAMQQLQSQRPAAAQSVQEASTATGAWPAVASCGVLAAAAGAGIRARGRKPKVAKKARGGEDRFHGIKFENSKQKDAYADLEYINDVGYLPDGTPMNMAGNAVNHPETIQPDLHNPGSPLPRANFVNSIGYLPDGTPLNRAGNAINHPETIGPDPHTPGSPLPASVYAAETGYLVDGTPLELAGNAINHMDMSAGAPSAPAAPAPAPAAAPAAAPVPAMATAAFVGAETKVRRPIGFSYAFQQDAYADLKFQNDVGYLPDGTPMNRAGNAINHPENIQPDPHAPGSPLPRASYTNDVGYLPDGTPMNAAGNAINHPETIGPDLHTPGSALPPSAYAADIGYLVDGTPMAEAGNNSIPR